MDEQDVLAERFEAHRPRLRAVAYQALGSAGEADDAVQETWLRLSRADPGTIENLGGWLTRVVARVCLNLLAARRDEPAGVHLPDSAATATDSGPEAEALLADSIGPALLVILHTLAPAERISFVLHDIFAVPFDDIAAIVGRSPAAARQLASRARRRVQGIAPGPGTDLARQRAITDAFLAAARSGNFGALLETLDPDAVVRSNGTEVVRGAAAVARRAFPFTRTAKVILPAVINGGAGVITATDGRPVTLVGFTITDSKITAIDLIDDPHRIAEADLAILGRARPPAPSPAACAHRTAGSRAAAPHPMTQLSACGMRRSAREAATSDTTATPTVISARFVYPLER